MATDAASCRNVTSTQVSVCNAGENQAGPAITWCSDASCFYSIKCCKNVGGSDQPPANNNNNAVPPRPDTTFASEQQQSPGKSQLLGSQKMHTSTYNQPSPTTRDTNTTSTSRVGAGIGFAFVVIAIGAVIVWKRGNDKSVSRAGGESRKNSADTGSSSHKKSKHNSQVRREKKDPDGKKNPRVTRRGSSSNERRRRTSNSSNNSAIHQKETKKKENRTIYDSDSSLDNDFVINRRMSIDPVNSDSDSEFSVGDISI